MILTCPACTTRYYAGDDALGNRARKVRCAKCAHEWVIDPLVGVTASAVPSEATASPALPERLAAADIDAEPDTGGDIYIPRRAKFLTLDRAASALLALLLLGGLTLWLYADRVAVVRAWPQARGFYSALGLSVNVLGLEIRNTDWTIAQHDGMPVLTVSGDIINTTSKGLVVPRLELTLRDDKKRELYHWSVVLPAKRLKPGESAHFTATRQSPPLEAHDVEIRFTSGA